MFIEYAHDDVGEDDNEWYGDDDGGMTLNELRTMVLMTDDCDMCNVMWNPGMTLNGSVENYGGGLCL